MAEQAAATAVGPDELAALKHVALDGGLAGETKVSCAGLADRLDASNQTASRRLQRLDSAGLIEREVVGDGQWIQITDAGETALRAEYADYRHIFERDPELTLSGTVTGGMGEGRHYISLSGYMDQFRERLGYEPYPGTLNVELDEESIRARAALSALDAVPIDGWEDDERTFGAATCYPAELAAPNGDTFTPVHIIVPKRTHHDESQVELIAPDRLREALDLEDGERVEVRLGADGPGVDGTPDSSHADRDTGAAGGAD